MKLIFTLIAKACSVFAILDAAFTFWPDNLQKTIMESCCIVISAKNNANPYLIPAGNNGSRYIHV